MNTIFGQDLVCGLDPGEGLGEDFGHGQGQSWWNGWGGQGDPSAWAYFVRQGFDEICISTFLFALNIDICTNGYYYGMIVPGNGFFFFFT